MTDCEYILKQAKLFHYKGWDEEEMRKCVDMLVGLSRQELIVLYTSRWLTGVKPIREEIFKIQLINSSMSLKKGRVVTLPFLDRS